MPGFTPPPSPVGPGPAVHGFAITPSDTTLLPFPTRYIWIGGTGALEVLLAGDTVPVTFAAVPAGYRFELCAVKVMAANTTATGIVGLW